MNFPKTPGIFKQKNIDLYQKQRSKSSAWEVLAGCPRNVRHQAILYVTKIPSSFYFRLENWALGFGQSLWETARAATRFDAIQQVQL